MSKQNVALVRRVYELAKPYTFAQRERERESPPSRRNLKFLRIAPIGLLNPT
jgi:hypothetical protein